MKVKLETTEDGFRAVFEITSEEEAIQFHDQVAIKICQGPHKFIGAAYGRRLSMKENYDGLWPEVKNKLEQGLPDQEFEI